MRDAAQISLLLLSSVALTTISATGAEQSYPRVEFKYSGNFDRQCAGWLQSELKPEWLREILTKVRPFQEHWDNDATPLLGTVVVEMGRPFRARELVATLTLCPISSKPVPLLLNIRRFIEGTSASGPAPLSLLSAALFDELLHLYLAEAYGFMREGASGFDHSEQAEGLSNSRLLKKYQDESPQVRSHLHVKAIEKMVYLKLGRMEDLKAIVAFESTRPTQQRAWKIVNDLEDYGAFVNELKTGGRAGAQPQQ